MQSLLMSPAVLQIGDETGPHLVKRLALVCGFGSKEMYIYKRNSLMLPPAGTPPFHISIYVHNCILNAKSQGKDLKSENYNKPNISTALILYQ